MKSRFYLKISNNLLVCFVYFKVDVDRKVIRYRNYRYLLFEKEELGNKFIVISNFFCFGFFKVIKVLGLNIWLRVG